MQRRPAGLTAVVGSLLMMIFGIIEPSDVVAPFGSDTVIMVASVLILGSAVFETGAAEIIGSAIVRRMGRNEKLLIMVLVLTVSILSSFLSNSAVVAIFLPLLASLARSSGGAITKKNTYMAVGIASVVGGNCTLAGSTPQLTAQAILQTTDSVRELTFWELGKVGFPLVIVLALYYLFIGIRLQKKVFDFPEVEDPAPLRGRRAGPQQGQVYHGLPHHARLRGRLHGGRVFLRHGRGHCGRPVHTDRLHLL